VSVEIPVLSGRGMTLSDQLARWSAATPDACAVRFESAGRTYEELDERVTRLAWALTDRGVRAGDRVAVLGPNCIEVWESYLAGARLGAVVVPVSFRLVADEVAYILADSGSTVLIVHEEQSQVAAKACESLPELGTVLLIGSTEVELPGAGFEAALAVASAAPFDSFNEEHAPALIMYTSGTTGRPKGAVLTHRNLLMHAFSQIIHLGWSPDDRVSGGAVPLFHIAGLAGCWPPLLLGGTLVIMRSGGFDPVAILDLIERERISNIFLVPAMLAGMVAVSDLSSRDLSCLRRITWGAAPATRTLLRKVIDAFPQTEIVSGLGQTECSPGTCHLRGVDAIRKIGSVGKPMLNVEVRVVDEQMNDVPRGEVGEIVYRSPMVMKEYWGQPEATAEAFRGGWFHSGDLVRQDDEGYIYVVDRLKDMIISGGENIYCAEVEDVLAAHPKVGEVAVIGIPDADWGETPLAVILPSDPDDPPASTDVAAFCAEQLASFKRPRHVALVGTLPRSPSGKILKTQLRADYRAGRLAVQKADRSAPTGS
jgi:fatty-acyl-CoA synthase